MERKQSVRLWILLVVIALAGMFTQRMLSGGNTQNAQRVIGESKLYTQEEIGRIMDVVEREFRREFRGCTLRELKYDEELSMRQSADWAAQYDADEAVVLTSSFDVDGRGGDGSLNPNSSYTKWLWILTRTGSGDWILQTWGY